MHRTSFSLKINCDNAAFDGDDLPLEIGRLLRETAEKVEGGRKAGRVYDVNGNHVGDFKLDR